MNRLSIIVPHLGVDQPFEDTLVSVLQNRPSDCEVLVVHRGPYEDPYELDDEVCFVELEKSASTIEAINACMNVADGEIINLLCPGILAEEGWTEAAVERFNDRKVAAVAPLVLDAEDTDRIASAGACFGFGGRRVINGAGIRVSRAKRAVRRDIAGPTLSAAFYRRQVILDLDGLCPKVGDSHADIDLALAIQKLGYRCVLEPQSVLLGSSSETNAETAFRLGLHSERVYWRNRPESGRVGSTLAHFAAVAGSSVTKFYRADTYTGLMGRLVGALDRSNTRENELRLEAAIDRSKRSAKSKEVVDDEAPPTRTGTVLRRMAA